MSLHAGLPLVFLSGGIACLIRTQISDRAAAPGSSIYGQPSAFYPAITGWAGLWLVLFYHFCVARPRARRVIISG